MPKPYSYDLRQKVIQAIALDGMKKSVAAKSVPTESQHHRPVALSGRLKPETTNTQRNRPRGNGHNIIDWAKFREFAKTHGDKTQAQMAALWEGEISARTVSRTLQTIGFTRKKHLWRDLERDEAKRISKMLLWHHGNKGYNVPWGCITYTSTLYLVLLKFLATQPEYICQEGGGLQGLSAKSGQAPFVLRFPSLEMLTQVRSASYHVLTDQCLDVTCLRLREFILSLSCVNFSYLDFHIIGDSLRLGADF